MAILGLSVFVVVAWRQMDGSHGCFVSRFLLSVVDRFFRRKPETSRRPAQRTPASEERSRLRSSPYPEVGQTGAGSFRGSSAESPSPLVAMSSALWTPKSAPDFEVPHTPKVGQVGVGSFQFLPRKSETSSRPVQRTPVSEERSRLRGPQCPQVGQAVVRLTVPTTTTTLPESAATFTTMTDGGSPGPGCVVPDNAKQHTSTDANSH